tara:strand:- start:55 stop:702 length:648 start_codon:yes stop_codon:yes gene_type:complete
LINKENALIESLKDQPILVVLRLKETNLEVLHDGTPLYPFISLLNKYGIKNIEIAWSSNNQWIETMGSLMSRFSNIFWGAASINTPEALNSVKELNLNYAMSPVFDIELQNKARSINQLLIPGVFSPTEMQYAKKYGCKIVKLFPASILGIQYLNQISTPLEMVPFTIAAGGLSTRDLEPWLKAGYGAVALGRNLIIKDEIDSHMKKWLSKNKLQ